MSGPGTIGWFARHEARLAWRDWMSLLTAGRRRRIRVVALGFMGFAVFMHGLAYLMFGSAAHLADPPDATTLLVITGALAAGWSLMLSQALESVTRAFYARGDLELILTSPAAAARLFAVRIAAMAMTIVIMALLLAAPFINVLVWFGGARWLGAYAAAVALAMDATAAAVVVTIALFHAIGPRRTRGISQILAAVIGAGFAIAMQIGAILSFGTIPNIPAPRMASALVGAPDGNSPLWWPARAVLGEPLALAALLVLSLAALVATIAVFAPRFGQLALAASGAPPSVPRPGRRRSRFRASSPAWALRHKEWTLLARDPWLMSQTLMQLLYLLPAALLLWRNFQGGGASALVVPILIVAAGQLGGGLAWLAVSGEDAPDLIASAPVPAARVFRAKTEAVVGGIVVIFAPFIAMLAIATPFAALITLAFIMIAAASATAIQYWFRTQGRRCLFRRRQTSSRIATFAEALSSTFWAGTGALAAAGTWLAVVPGVIVLMVLAVAWMISPARSPAVA
ncbi:MAG: permease [Acetobacteraceae bacterium]|nr:permease [Acetobacteraceae bacterium]